MVYPKRIARRFALRVWWPVPGCYPTAVQLGFLPLLEAGIIDTTQLIASCGSGVSGAGRQAKLGSLLTEAGESLAAYGVAGHRHLPEMEQGLSGMTGEPVQLTFVPHSGAHEPRHSRDAVCPIEYRGRRFAGAI